MFIIAQVTILDENVLSLFNLACSHFIEVNEIVANTNPSNTLGF